MKNCVRDLAYEAIQTNQKQVALQGMWEQIFAEMVRSAVIDMWDPQAYMKKCLEELEKR